MNLFDLPEKELFDIKEVGLVLRDIALSYIPKQVLSYRDQVIYSTEEFNVLLIDNMVVLTTETEGDIKWSRRFAFAVNFMNLFDKRPFSTRFNKESGSYTIRYSYSNRILVIEQNSIFYSSVIGNDKYIDAIEEHISYRHMEPEIFQRALIETPSTMNAIMLNFLFRSDIPHHNHNHNQSEPELNFMGYISELELMSKVVPHISELRKLC